MTWLWNSAPQPGRNLEEMWKKLWKKCGRKCEGMWKKSGRKCEGMWKKSGTKSWESETRCIIVQVRPGAERSAIKSVGLSDAT